MNNHNHDDNDFSFLFDFKMEDTETDKIEEISEGPKDKKPGFFTRLKSRVTSFFKKPISKKLLISMIAVLVVICTGLAFLLSYHPKKETKVNKEKEEASILEELHIVDNSNPIGDEIMPQIANIFTSRGFNYENWQFYIIDCETGQRASWNSHSQLSASIIKQFIAGTVFEDWDELVKLYPEDTINSALKGMITISDNDCANTCIEILGRGDYDKGCERVNEYTAKYGYNDTNLDHPFYLTNTPDVDNKTSARDVAEFQMDVVQGKLPGSDKILELLKGQKFRHKIPGGLPANVKTANKTGDLWCAEHDCAIIFNDDGTPNYIFGVMSENIKDTNNARNSIRTASRALYDWFLEYRERQAQENQSDSENANTEEQQTTAKAD